MEIIRRVDAKAAGRSTYFTGKPCKRGHIAKRETSSGSCVECKRLKKRAGYQANPQKEQERARQYRARNPEKAKASVAKWQAANKAQVLGTAKLWRANNPEKVRKYDKEKRMRAKARGYKRRKPDPDKAREWHRKCYNANRKKYNARRRAWAAENPDAVRAAVSKRRARLRGATEIKVSTEELRRLKKTRCHICGKPFSKRDPATMDHVTPLAKGGQHVISNLAMAHSSCNKRKGAERTHLI